MTITFPPPPPRQLTALIAIALAALTLAAGTAEARCTLSDVKMTKTFPSGNPGRLTPNDSVIINFELPADCPVANPPLEVCVVVWDNSPCDRELDSIANRCDGNYAGAAGVNMAAGWSKNGRSVFCRSDLLIESPTPGVANSAVTMLISTAYGDVFKSRNQNRQSHLALIMYEPARALVIPITND